MTNIFKETLVRTNEGWYIRYLHGNKFLRLKLESIPDRFTELVYRANVNSAGQKISRSRSVRSISSFFFFFFFFHFFPRLSRLGEITPIHRLLATLCCPGDPIRGPSFAPSTAYRLAGRHSTAVPCQGYFARLLGEKRRRKWEPEGWKSKRE